MRYVIYGGDTNSASFHFGAFLPYLNHSWEIYFRLTITVCHGGAPRCHVIIIADNIRPHGLNSNFSPVMMNGLSVNDAS